VRSPSAAWSLLVFGVVFGPVGCKPKLQATLKGLKEGNSNVAVVHVVAKSGYEVKCTDRGQRCATAYVPSSGEVDLDVWMMDEGKPKKAFVEASRGSKKVEVEVDLTTLPPSVAVMRGYGTISCTSKECSGALTVAPSSKISLKAPAGTLVEIGSDKLTVPASGVLDAPVGVGLTPPIDKQPIDKVCIGLVGGATPDAVLGTTTLTLTFPDKVKVVTKIELTSVLVQRNLAAALKNVAKGAVLFPWEKAGGAARGKKAAIFVEDDQCYDAGQAGATIGDLDEVALADERTRVSDCTYELSGERDNKDYGTASGKISLYDSHATAYDRITGKRLAEKVFLAPKNCTKNIRLGTVGTKIADQAAYANEDQIAAWAVTLAK